MHLIYIDDSRDEKLCIFSALAIPATEWRNVFQHVKKFRHDLQRSDGISIYSEFHAWKFVSGRGALGAKRIIGKSRRCQIFKDTLLHISGLPGVRLFNACLPADKENWAFERLLNRINRTLQVWDSRAILICDVGKDAIYTRLCRRMGVFNPIPSKFGHWLDTGSSYRNIPIERIIEDPFFKDSKRSYFVQFADFCAYSLLRRENPLPSKSKYGLHEAFNLLSPILVKAASTRDPEGIIR